MSTQILLYSLCSSAGMYVICYFWLWPVHHKWILDEKHVHLIQHTWHSYREPQPLGRQATTTRSGANTIGYHWAHWASGARFGRHSTTDDLVWTAIVYHNTWEFVATKSTPMDTFQTPPTQQKCLLFYWPLIFLSRTFYVLVLLVATLTPLYNLSTPHMHSSVLGILVSWTTGTLLPNLLCSNHYICGVMQTVPSS
jgi:hypothetical protein